MSDSQVWSLYIDSFANKEGSGVGLLYANPNGQKWPYALIFNFPISNNEVEYKALITRLNIAW